MKRSTPWLVRLVSAVILVGSCSCNQRQSVDYSAMHVYQPPEIGKIIESAYKIENVGTPTVQRTETANGASIIVTSNQVYRVYVATSKDDHLVPKAEAAESAKGAGSGGPIIIVASCEMTCTPVRPGEPCNISGCMPTDRCGCNQGSCGNNCTTDSACHPGLAGFGFGKPLIMF